MSKGVKNMKKVATDAITLVYRCPECNEEYSQLLTEVVESGTATCSECDCNCELEDFVYVDA